MAGERIFIVEDDRLQVRHLTYDLERLGYRPVGHASSGGEALRELPDATPDIVLMDITLAGDMDGIEAARRIGETFGLPVIFMTADDDPRTLSRALDASPYNYISKPVGMLQLHSALATALERARLEKRLKASEEKLAAILDILPSFIVLSDADGRIVWANGAATATCGKLDGVSREAFFSRFRPPDPSTTGTDECELILEDGPRLRQFSLITVEVPDMDVPGGQILDCLREITARKLLEAENLRQAHLASLGELAAGVAHEINNPISGIMGYAERLADKADRLDAAEAHIPGRILGEAERISGIVRKLLAFARPGETVREPVDVRDVVHDSLSLTRAMFRHDDVEVELCLPPDLPRAMANAKELQQVIINLITNAQCALRAALKNPEKPRRLTVQASVYGPKRQAVRLSFADNGVGVPADILPRIFEPFFTTKPKHEGTGLGLSISLKLIQAMGGRLWIESREGVGTTAFIELPLAGGAA